MAKPLVLLFVLLGLCWKVVTRNNKYDNYTLLKITPQNKKQLEALVRLGMLRMAGMNFLKRSYGVNDVADVLVAPDRLKDLEHLVHKYSMPVKTKRNYGRMLERVKMKDKRFHGKLNDYTIHGNWRNFFNVFRYNSYDVMTKYIESLATQIPGLVQVKTVGESYEKRKMQLVKISTNTLDTNPIIFIDAGIHAREWVAPAMAMYLIHRLTEPAARLAELDSVDWYILPVVNPDGYEFSRKYDRMWRKTRSQHSNNTDCVGVDGNRNYDFNWGGTGVSDDPCDWEVYAGPKPFSEVETKIVSKIMSQNKGRIKLYVSLHAYGQYLVYPWGYTDKILPKNWKKLDDIAKLVSSSVQKAGGQPFRVMSSGQWYATSGGSDDYAFGIAKIPYVFTMELTDGYEFSFPELLLAAVLPQYYEGFKTFSALMKLEFVHHVF